jgi:trehalose/maltose hydrolase-like predicted phosphorylase
MHGLVAARLGYSEMALRYFAQTSAIDLSDTDVAIDGGVHIAALGGIWMTAVLGFAGVSLRSDGIGVDPQLPASWRSLAFSIQWRRRRLRIRIDQGSHLLEATLEAGDPMTLIAYGKARQLRHGETVREFQPSTKLVENAPNSNASRPSIVRNRSAVSLGG